MPKYINRTCYCGQEINVHTMHYARKVKKMCCSKHCAKMLDAAFVASTGETSESSVPIMKVIR